MSKQDFDEMVSEWEGPIRYLFPNITSSLLHKVSIAKLLLLIEYRIYKSTFVGATYFPTNTTIAVPTNNPLKCILCNEFPIHVSELYS